MQVLACVSWFQPRVVWGIQPSEFARPSLHCRIENKTTTATAQPPNNLPPHLPINYSTNCPSRPLSTSSMVQSPCSSTQLLKPKASVICPHHHLLNLPHSIDCLLMHTAHAYAKSSKALFILIPKHLPLAHSRSALKHYHASSLTQSKSAKELSEWPSQTSLKLSQEALENSVKSVLWSSVN